jgi:hypothetical protein
MRIILACAGVSNGEAAHALGALGCLACADGRMNKQVAAPTRGTCTFALAL